MVMSKNIKINSIKDIKEFVQQATKVEDKVIVNKTPYSVDGKSLMGLMSIDLSQGVEVIFSDEETEFAEYLKSLEI